MKDWVQIQKLKLALTASFLERTNHLFLQFWNQDMWIVTTLLSDDPLLKTQVCTISSTYSLPETAEGKLEAEDILQVGILYI